MQRKKAFLFCAMAALMSFSQAYAVEHIEDAGKFEIKSAHGNFGLGIGGLLQPTAEVKYKPENKEWEGLQFNLNKARLRLYGNAFDPALTFLFQAQFEKDAVAKGDRKGSGSLLDYTVNWAVNYDWFQVAVGKFAIPGSRQQVIWAAKTQFLVNSELLNEFNYVPNGRDVGVLFHNAWNHHIEYALAIVSNGISARLGYNHGAIDGYNAVDFAGGGLRFGLGVNGMAKSDYLTSLNFLGGSADYIVKYKHFASNGAFYYKREDQKNIYGAGLEAGYLINHKWEPVLRYGWANKGQHNHEIMAGLNHYWFGHSLKGEIYAGTRLEQGKDKTQWPHVLLGVGMQFAL